VIPHPRFHANSHNIRIRHHRSLRVQHTATQRTRRCVLRPRHSKPKNSEPKNQRPKQHPEPKVSGSIAKKITPENFATKNPAKKNIATKISARQNWK
jgi:hypothetical protein